MGGMSCTLVAYVNHPVMIETLHRLGTFDLGWQVGRWHACLFGAVYSPEEEGNEFMTAIAGWFGWRALAARNAPRLHAAKER